jgi:DNA invertase Pin-like site-specific DNA recombinase
VPAKRADLIGYVRVSTDGQDTALQRDALAQAGCAKVFEDKVSTRQSERPGLAAALGYLRAGDTLAVWKLDRLGRSVKEVLTLADELHGRGIGLRILTGTLAGTYSPTGEGKFFFTVMAAVAELERDVIHQRTMAGLAAARAQGRIGGRPTVMDADKIAAATARLARGEGPTQVAHALGVSRATLYRHTDVTAVRRDHAHDDHPDTHPAVRGATGSPAVPGPAQGTTTAGRQPSPRPAPPPPPSRKPAARRGTGGPQGRVTVGPPAAGPVHQLKVTLEEVEPLVWRRLQLKSAATLADLHVAIQVAFGWEDYHLHVFTARWGERYGHEGRPETITLAQVAPNVGDRLGYVYDLGDYWQLLITVEKVLAGTRPRPGTSYPRCTGGRRAAPPEDCGGPYGYADMLKVLRSRKGWRYRELRERLGTGRWDAEAFDLDEVNTALARTAADG